MLQLCLIVLIGCVGGGTVVMLGMVNPWFGLIAMLPVYYFCDFIWRKIDLRLLRNKWR
jgi:hypothetical protein